MSCSHVDYDENFEVCNDCGAGPSEVIKDSLSEHLQPFFTMCLEARGITSGDIDPLTAEKLDQAELALATVVANWLALAGRTES